MPSHKKHHRKNDQYWSQQGHGASSSASSSGWPAERTLPIHSHPQNPEMNYPYLDPRPANSFLSSDSDFHAVYDPARVRQPIRPNQPQPYTQEQNYPEWPRDSTVQSAAASQPSNVPGYPSQYQQSMDATGYGQYSSVVAGSTAPQAPELREPPCAIRRQPHASKPPSRLRRASPYSDLKLSKPERALAKRDSNGVSEFGSDEERDATDLREYNVSPDTTRTSSRRAEPNSYTGNNYNAGWYTTGW
ncbi:hypothetical protein F4804DRAFT_295885 [Jackrogersella minutella]|nr:hypothetical protein F4804DRAFT_295885 [Jackrogersella minutella]